MLLLFVVVVYPHPSLNSWWVALKVNPQVLPPGDEGYNEDMTMMCSKKEHLRRNVLMMMMTTMAFNKTKGFKPKGFKAKGFMYLMGTL